MSEDFKAGDRVLVNGTIIATLELYDVPNNRVAWVAKVGRTTDHGSGPLSHTRIESLSSLVEQAAEVHERIEDTVPIQASEHTGVEVSDKDNPNPSFPELQ